MAADLEDEDEDEDAESVGDPEIDLDRLRLGCHCGPESPGADGHDMPPSPFFLGRPTSPPPPRHDPNAPPPGSTWRPALFTNIPRGVGSIEPDLDLKVLDAAMRSTAAPTYFPSVQGFVDGGVFCNNPSMVALSRALHSFGDTLSLDDMAVLSLGTGATNLTIPGKDLDWGILQWAPWLLSLLFESQQATVDLILDQVLADRYCRLNEPLPTTINLDDTSCIDEMIALADAVDISQAVAFARKYVKEEANTRGRSMSL